MPSSKNILISLILLFVIGCSAGFAEPSPVRGWETSITIPTYKTGPANPNPFFFNGRIYQGAKGEIYPYPLQDSLSDEKIDKDYKAVYLENEYVRICVIPELGGRIFEAVDKTNNYDFFYRQHVVKPALIGALGAWISGGVEWDLPHHHRASSFMPVDYKLVKHEDGSQTIWVGEIERRHRIKWMVGLTLRPESSVLKATVKLVNRTPVAHSFLYWANVAVHANEDYQVIFPPSTQFATHHSKVQFSKWPVSDSIYGGADYRNGVDVSWWKNHVNANSMFCWNFTDDFLAGYDHGKQAGTMHVADHNTVAGKKLFTWGRDERAQNWDQSLTDDDGPYLELMVGSWSDNQPDYSWAQPYEVKETTQYWYPFRGIGGVKNATVDAAVNLEVKDGRVTFGFHTTARHEVATARLDSGGRIVFETNTAISPDRPYLRELPVPDGVRPEDLKASLLVNGKELVSYSPPVIEEEPIPEAVRPPPEPEDIQTNEELYYAGLRLEQFYNPNREPYPYYEEALRRDPDDYRVNTQLGLLHIKRGLFSEAEAKLRAAVKRITRGYTRPKDGEALYYLGVALKAQGKLADAEVALNRAAWSYAWSAPSYYQLAEIFSQRGDYARALAFTDMSLDTNRKNLRALHLKAALLRKLDRGGDAVSVLASLAEVDPISFSGGNEVYHSLSRTGMNPEARRALADVNTLMRGDVQNYLELAVTYGHAGMWDDAIAVIDRKLKDSPDLSLAYPMLHYFRAYFSERRGDADGAAKSYRLAAAAPLDYCFPYRMEAIEVFERAMKHNPRDGRAAYYLGNLLYDHQPENALAAFEKAVRRDPGNAIAHRNLGLAQVKVEGALGKAIASLERSIELRQDALVLFELDQIHEQAGTSAAKRLEILEGHQRVVEQRDDALSREVALLVAVGRYEKALSLLGDRHVYRWEGLDTVHTSYVDAHIFRGHRHFEAGEHKEALADYRAAAEFPRNLEAAKGYRDGTLARPYYNIGRTQQAMGNEAKAKEFFEKTVAEGEEALTVNSLNLTVCSSIAYYQAQALRRIGRHGEANEMFSRMISVGQKTVDGQDDLDIYAKFGSGRDRELRLSKAHLVIALGYLGQNKKRQAVGELDAALELNPGDPKVRWALVDARKD